MKREYKIRLNMMGTTPEEIAESFDVNKKYTIKSSGKKSMAYSGNKPVINITETSPDYYNIWMTDKVMHSLLERRIIHHGANKRMAK